MINYILGQDIPEGQFRKREQKIHLVSEKGWTFVLLFHQHNKEPSYYNINLLCFPGSWCLKYFKTAKRRYYCEWVRK